MINSIFALIKYIWVVPLFLAVLLPSNRINAVDVQSAWFKDSALEFSMRNDAVSDKKYPSTYGGRGNIDCSNLSLKKRDGIVIDLILKLYKESPVSGCYIESSVGSIDTNGYVNVNGTDYAAEMVKNTGQPTSHMVFPGSDMFISNASTSPALGAHVWFDHLQSSIKLTNLPNGKIFAVIKPTNQAPLTDRAGNMLPVMADNFSISDNGEWLVVDSPGKALLRINLTTMEVLPFTNSFEFGNGIGAALRTTISSDGRFVVIASKNYSTFKLYDLSTCSPAPNVITTPVPGCKSRDLLDFTRSKINDLGTILQVRFLTDELVKFYASYDISTTLRIGEFVVAAPNTYLTGMDYLGLGDSFSSGEGAQKYEIGTDEKGINMCHLSKVSYPYLIAEKIQANNFHSVACSSARTFNVQGGTGYSKDKSKKDRDNQYNSDERPANDPLADWAPGYRKQVSFISINNPKITTVSVAGNDIGFVDKLKACLKPWTCFPTYEDRQEVFNEVDAKLGTFTTTYKKLKDAATKNARVYVVGYPQIALSGGNCAANVHMNENELVFAESLIARLNTVIRTAATNAEVNYIDIEDAFTGFRLCENDTGNIAMNGLTAGKDILEILGNESYHPNEFGHELMAAKILGVTNNLGNVDPITVPIKLPKIKDTDPALKKAPKTGRVVKKRVSTKAKTTTVKKGKKVTIKLSGVKDALPPNSPIGVTVDGIPVDGTTTDENGDAEVEITIPPDTPPGPVVIDITGDNITGEPVVIGTVVDVGNDSDDFDGDGLPDMQDSCPAFPNAFEDRDQDGTDDACDAVISPAPSSPAPAQQVNLQGGITIARNTSNTPPSTTTPPTLGISENGGETSPLLAGSEREESPPQTLAAEIVEEAHENMVETAAVHPIRFLTILLTLLFLMIVLILKQWERRKPLFLSAYSEGYPAVPNY